LVYVVVMVVYVFMYKVIIVIRANTIIIIKLRIIDDAYSQSVVISGYNDDVVRR
jgi:Na+/alanine symporter